MASLRRGLADEARSMAMANLFPMVPDNVQPWEEDYFKDIFGEKPLFEEPMGVPRQILPQAVAPDPVKRISAVHLGSPSELIQRRSSARAWAKS
eukprot:6135546-Amphidinium_carterae.1